MGCCGSTATVPPSPLPSAQAVDQRETVQSTHPTSMSSSTLLSKPSATTLAHERFLDSASSQHPRGSGSSLQRSRFISDASHAALPQGALSHSSRTRTASASASMLGRSRLPAEGYEGRPRFPSTLKSLLPNDFRFRILVVGKRESGKSSLINAVFKANMSVCTQSSLHSYLANLFALQNYKGAPINISGRTTEFLPRDNRHLIVHECSGSGPRDLQAIRDFVTTRNQKGRPASERLHAIWICVPTSDAIDGQFDNNVKELSGIGVPLILVFTKFDESDKALAKTKCEEHRRSLPGNVRAELVSTRPKFRSLIEKLVTTTDEVINAHSRDISAPSEAQRTPPQISPVTLAWSVSQRTSRDINVQGAIERVTSFLLLNMFSHTVQQSWAKQLLAHIGYWRGLWYSDDFAGQTLADCVEVIRTDIVGVWNLPDKDKYLSNPEFKVGISYLVQDLSGAKADRTPGTGAAWLNNRYENSNENICLVVGYIVDLTLILCSVFRSSGNVSPSDVQSVMDNFDNSRLKTSIHAEISRFIRTVPRFNYHDNDVVMEKIIDLIRQNCDKPFV
ncbi:hypothetical protein DFH94DRAFT_695408 [Russula ochroleuca]|uniref:G domain-containing protein n=1 Tax=Russula ochroleuca TaxID=152965 RepID=A0A9P5K0A3_9AGAM|nr:hypothetical protein DFH94DRAFT_695408 [Russula ochroleuca]